ncbi:MAG TPA: transglycosylase domain-containing protein [Flavobacteriales bacterium]|nr:transglycosylase domain-containing protein [Flavobacteriales bacterium]HRE97005.1 transglycosylase domain-containing protein [Flavobacteriales bacterium]HRJ34872.1 transglycosylase domain-containing protein [Flavobacteriales bacterium]HRJ39140.1 transglycosylase domain-containing protein [Flavobacteriales bacterium]
MSVAADYLLLIRRHSQLSKELLSPLAKRIFRFSIFNWSKFRSLRWFIKPLSLLYSFFLSIALFVLAIELNFLWLFGTMPSISMVANPDLPTASEVYSADGVLLGKFFQENREPIEFGDLNNNIINALVVTEDVRFYKHWGIDLKSIAGAVYSTARGDKRGGSTLTQQLAKNLFKTRKRRSTGLLGYLPYVNTVIAKSKEWITAVKLEMFYTKEDILTMYLNTVDFGHNTFGIKVAAHSYFGVYPKDLSVPQASLLVGLLKAPTYYSPLKNPERCLKRRNTVIGQLLKYGKITTEEHDLYCSSPLGVEYREYSYSEGIAPYFRTAVAKSLSEWQKESGYNIFSDGLIIHTTLDSRMQAHAERAVAIQMKALQQRFKMHWSDRKPWQDKATAKNKDGFLWDLVRQSDVYKKLKKKYPDDEKSLMAAMEEKKKMKIFTWEGEKEVQYSSLDSIKHYIAFLHCGMITIDPANAHVKVYVGGVNYDYFKYDHVSVAMNQPGSTFKPFVYTTAIEKGWGPCDKLPDVPVAIKYKENGENKVWTPHNADWSNSGQLVTLRHAMGRSINTVTALLTEKVGWENVAELAKRMGIKSPLKAVPSIGLGSNDVTLIELIGAYSVYMNKGIWNEPMLVTHITDRKGNTIAEFKPESRRAISEETAWLMTYMLRGGFEEPGGTSQALWEFKFVHGNEVGGKTGTSSNYADGWYIGLTKDYVTGVWVGADDNRIRFRTSETGEGARTALPVYGKFMDLLYTDKKLLLSKGKFPEPGVTISKPHNCRTFASYSDSGIIAKDSVLISNPVLPEVEGVPEENPEN